MVFTVDVEVLLYSRFTYGYVCAINQPNDSWELSDAKESSLGQCNVFTERNSWVLI